VVKRWGDAAATYDSVDVDITPELIVIRTKITGKRVINDPIFGVLISNLLGETVCGTNTKIIHKKTGLLEANESKDITWEIPNILTTGSYRVDVAITYADGITQADWWHEAATFKVTNKESTPHVVSPRIKLLSN
jgi:hypothetical protein